MLIIRKLTTEKVEGTITEKMRGRGVFSDTELTLFVVSDDDGRNHKVASEAFVSDYQAGVGRKINFVVSRFCSYRNPVIAFHEASYTGNWQKLVDMGE